MPMWIQVFLAIPKIIKAIAALVAFVKSQQEAKRVDDLEKLKKDIGNATSEDDFRNVAGRL